jgi:hypothetical protein
MEERSYSGTAVALVLLGVMLAGIVYRYWPSDEREIRRHLSNLAEVLSSPGNESEVAHLTRVAALREYFAPEVKIQLGGEQIVSREALMALVGRWTPPPGGVVVEFVDVTVTLAGDHQSADISLTAKASAGNSRNGESTVDAREAALEMRNADGDWVITSVEARETLARP